MAKKLISYDDTKPGTGLPQAVEARIDGRYATKAELAEIPDNVVTSPHGLNLRLTDDPDFLGDEGDLVFYYETWKHYLDLGATGLNGLTPRYRESPGWVEQDGYIRYNPGSGVARAFQSVDALDAQPDATDVEIVAKLRADRLFAGYAPGVIVRGSGDADTGNAYLMTMNTRGVHLGGYVNGEWVNHRTADGAPPANTWIWMRLRAIGAQVTGRWWVDGDTEPTTWHLSHTLAEPELLGSGWAGLQTSSGGGHDFAAVGVAVDGASAPVAP